VNADDFIGSSVDSYLSDVSEILERLPGGALEQVIRRLEEARWNGQAVFTCGNGGSAATAIHFASDLAKGATASDKPTFRSMSLCENVSLVTAWANDASYEEVFAQRLAPWARPGDVLIAISGSGNSPNVLKAVSVARSAGATTIAFTGFDGGKIKDMVDTCIIVPSSSMEQVEDVHLLLCHAITRCLRTLPAKSESAVVLAGRALWNELTLKATAPEVAGVTHGNGESAVNENTRGNGRDHHETDEQI
jgi:D-sedoheptulose 7-phosphate isomerase